MNPEGLFSHLLGLLCRHSGGSRNPEKSTGFRVKHVMTANTPLLATG
jgi:hypothetical protein